MESWELERLKYCRIERINGELKYYVMNDDDPVEVSKEVYLVIEHSYHKEWLMEHGAHSDWISLEQLAEDEEGNIIHDRVPAALQLPSAEEEYLLSAEQEAEDEIIDALYAEIDTLPAEKKRLVLSYTDKNGAISALAKQDNVSETAIYRRRSRLAKTLAKKVSGESNNE